MFNVVGLDTTEKPCLDEKKTLRCESHTDDFNHPNGEFSNSA